VGIVCDKPRSMRSKRVQRGMQGVTGLGDGTGLTVKLENITVGYGDYIVLREVTLVLRGPGLVQILGPNGAGKTTLLRTILGFIKPLKGRVLVNDIDVTGRPSQVGKYAGYVPQLEPSARHYPITAWELIETECEIRCRDGNRRRIEEVLSRVGLPREAWHRPIGRLSGGQRQRVFIARALVHDPPLLVMDEPFSAVDPAGKAGLAELIGWLSNSKLVIVTSHDPMLLLKYTRTVVLVNRGVVAVGTPEEVLRRETLEKVYGGAVLVVGEHPHIFDEHGHGRRRW